MNPVLRFLQDLGKAKTNALSVIVTMRPDPATLRIVSDSPGLLCNQTLLNARIGCFAFRLGRSHL